MVQLSKHLEDIVKYEPLLLDVLRREKRDVIFNQQHARILAMMFKLGGYTTLNVLTEFVNLAQPTVSQKVQELVNGGFLRKNSEQMPIALVLLLDASNLEKKLDQKIRSQRNAIEFITRILEKVKDINSVIDSFIQALNALYPDNVILAKMIAYVYTTPSISRNRLFQQIGFNDQDKLKAEKQYDEILMQNQEIFQIVYQKHKKKDMFISPRLPLTKFVDHRLLYVESLFEHYRNLLEELKDFDSEEYEAIIPHQFLNFHSEVKQKIEACLKHYTKIRIINNSIFKEKYEKEDLITVIAKGNSFRKTHKLLILSNNGISTPKNVTAGQISIKPFKKSFGHDYLARDFIIFDNHGCLVIPAKSTSIPYYNISPRFTANLLRVFESSWKDNNAI